MTDKIIALVDGSAYAESVCEHAAWVARLTARPVELLHVLGRREVPEKTDLSGAIRLGARSALLAELAELDEARAKLVAQKGRAILDDARAIVMHAEATQVSARLLQGDIVETLAAEETGAGLIVIGKRGEAADFARGHLGSNLERIVRACHRPVLVAARAFRPIGKVLVAHDGGASAQKAVAHLAQDALFADLSIELVTIGAETPETRAQLEAARKVLADAGRATTARILPGQPETALGDLVEAEGFHMVVMGAYGHSRIRSLIIGSTTTAMIRSCKVPVLLMR